LRIVRRLAVFLLVVAPIGFVIGTTEAGAITNTTATTFSPVPTTPQAYGSETIATTTFTAVVTGTGPASDFPEGTVSIVANPGNITICDSDFGSGTTTVTAPNITNYACTGNGLDTFLNTGVYTVEAKYVAGNPSASLVGFNYTGSTSATDPYTVTQLTPTLATVLAGGPYQAGQTVNDVANLSGSMNATGTVTFTYYWGVNNCSNTAIDTVNGNVSGASANANIPLPNTTGTTFSVSAHYNGDTNNAAATATCEAGAATVPAAAVITTVATNATLGGSIQDTVTLTGLSGTNATGLVTVTAQSVNCSGAGVFSVSLLIQGNISSNVGTVVAQYTPVATGTYVWSVSYAGDGNNAPEVEACGGTNETSTVSAVPTPPPGLVINNFFLPSVMHGRLYSVLLTASGGAAPPVYTWSLSAGLGQQLPPGIHVNSATGLLSGTAGVAGHYTFTITVHDSTSPATTTSETFHLTIT